MAKRRMLGWVFVAAVLLTCAGLAAAAVYYADLPSRLSQHETILLGQDQLVPGSQSAMRVLVRDSSNGDPLPDAEVIVSLRPEAGGQSVEVFRGRTDDEGTTAISFEVPQEVEVQQVLIVETSSRLGSDRLEKSITIQRDFRVLLTTDKPIYQPGQTIHMRALALGSFDLVPAENANIEITIADGKGNKVFRKQLLTSEFGVAAADFILASEVNSGAYKISAILGNTTTEQTVTVEHYVLPKFKISLTTDKGFYLPGDRLRGSLEAAYFFGKPVAGGEVLIEGYTFDFQRVVTATITGKTDEEGHFEFEMDLPDFLAGSTLEGGQARFYLQASVTDLAIHTEVVNISAPVSSSGLFIEAVPESGQFRPFVENILYVMTQDPLGNPVECQLNITNSYSGQVLTAETGEFGLAEVRFDPNDHSQYLIIEARDKQGQIAVREFFFEGQWSEETILLRPEKPIYRIGQSMALTILTSNRSGTVYLDITRQGQTLSTRSLTVADGRAEAVIDLSPDLYGTIELHAYKVMPSGNIVRDTRLVVVEQSNDLIVNVSTGSDTYLPGEDADVNLQVDGLDGNGVHSAIGLAIVDESVFALAEQDPGFAKLYFLLEQELLVPRYDLHGFTFSDMVMGIPTNNPELRSAINNTAQASLASAENAAGLMPFSLQANSRQEALARANQKKDEFFEVFGQALLWLLILLPVALLICTGVALAKKKILGSSIGISVLILFALVPITIILIGLLGQSNWTFYNPNSLTQWAPYLLILAAFLALVGLIISAIRKKDGSLGWHLLGLVLVTAALVGIYFASYQGNFSPDNKWSILLVISLGIIPLGLVLRSSGLFLEKRILPGLAGLYLVFLLAIALFPLGGGVTSSALPREFGNGGVVVEDALGMAPPFALAPMATEAPVAQEVAGGSDKATGSQGEAPRLRQYFPETMLWLPDAITDENGSLSLTVPVADSITTWRMTVLASSQDGRLGSTQAGLRVFQEFFIDLDLPLSLTVGDEISVPVGVFNYLSEEQTVRLELDQADWFHLLDEPVKELTIAANDITVVYFRIQALDFGRQPFKVTAWGSSMSDAILKEVTVYPDGKQINLTRSDRLVVDEPVAESIMIPPEAIPGTQKLLVKIYPGVLSQVVEGLDSILRMPNGCFEQTSSTTYPNVLVLDYLRSSNQVSPEAEMKAEEYINLGYQRLLTFEVQSSGGFSLFGDVPADRMLTAYGLQEFSDMSRVYEIDPALIRRAAEWLLSQQDSDGTWANDRGLVHENTWSSLGDDRLPVTAYITWSLIEAGYYDDTGVQKALETIRERQNKAEDAYVLALVANALVAGDLQSGDGMSPSTQAVLDRLADKAVMAGSGASWESGIATFMGSEGNVNSIETTALAAYAFLRSGSHSDLANAALVSLVREKDSFGTWYSTQATVLTLKALLESIRVSSASVDAQVTLSLNGGQMRQLTVNAENYDVVQLVSFDDVNPGRENLVKLSVSGTGELIYQVVGSFYLPWPDLSKYPELDSATELVTIDVAYDRTELAVNETVGVAVKVELIPQGATAESAIIDLGLPPGFSVEGEDLASLVAYYNDVPQDYAFARIQRYELTGRQIIIYITNLNTGMPLEFTYRLRANYPLRAQTPASTVYDYYNPDVTDEYQPIELIVND